MRILILGAGPAGLTAAYEAQDRGVDVTILEISEEVGGISKTVNKDGWLFDLGGHRFFSKVTRVEEFWHSILEPDEFLKRPRLSRIYYNGHFFDYPLSTSSALKGLGLLEISKCIASYAWVRISPPKDQSNFEGWVAARFGWRLYRIFFKTYTEKVWGIDAREIQADWAAQRIKSLSLSSAILHALGLRRRSRVITTLIDTFEYPKFGPGMMWNRVLEKITSKGTRYLPNSHVLSIGRNTSGLEVNYTTPGGPAIESFDFIVSSIPLSEIASLCKSEDESVKTSSKKLRYRDFLTVALVLPITDAFPDNWIYIHTPEVKVGRIQNFGSWSPFLVKEGHSCLGLEYFVSSGDEHWEMSDDDLIKLAIFELKTLNIVDTTEVKAGYVVRVPRAYPVYDREYKESVGNIQNWLGKEWPEVYQVGRNGQHRYNNQDHSMLTAMFAIENILDGAAHDVWAVNLDDEYHEEKTGTTERLSPIYPSAPSS